LILQPKVSDVKYFPLEFIKPIDQVDFSVTELFDDEVWWWPLPFVIGFLWWSSWLIDGFFSTGGGRLCTVGGISDGGSLTEGFGLDKKLILVVMFC
jgi:hypothetical protein